MNYAKGKISDQCDRESGKAKTLMRSYVDAGNDITAALDIVTALKHGNGLHNSKASVYFSHVKFSNKLVSSKK